MGRCARSAGSLAAGGGPPVVQGLVAAHGGNVTGESELGRRSAFRTVLPVSAAGVARAG